MAQAIPLHQHSTLNPSQKLASVNEESWLQVGKVAEMMNELDRAVIAYESALRHNPYSIPAMNQIAAILRAREQFPRAVEFYQSILNLDQNNGEVWGALGHCYLMMDDLQKAYSAYQQALYHLQNPKEPKLWYGIGILYDRYGSLEHAEEAFSQVMRMDPGFEKANEIYFRLGIIYKQQHKYAESLACFRYIIASPPKPLTEVDVWFQIGHVYEQQKEYGKAKEAYERVLSESPDHAKVLQQLGWLYHQQSSTFANQDLAISYLTKSLESDGQDAQSWYLLGRCYMAQQKYNKAYEAYQQAVYRDGRNPTFWCSIGVLYYQINQYRDALDAYSRAIRLNPYISEVWYDLGTLYESCNNQVSDALDAYSRAAELDPGNPHIKARLELLRSGQSSGARPGQAAAPLPQDVNPNAYQNTPQGPPTQWGGHPAGGPGGPQQPGAPPGHPGQGPPPPHHAPAPLQQPPMHQQQAPPARSAATNQQYATHRENSIKSPEQSKHALQTNGHGRSGSASKSSATMAQPPAVQPHPPHASYQAQSAPVQAPRAEETRQAVPTPTTQTTDGNLAPMLGRTSPVHEIKSLETVRDGSKSTSQRGSPRRSSKDTAAATEASKEAHDATTLKRPHSVMADTQQGESGRESKKLAAQVSPGASKSGTPVPETSAAVPAASAEVSKNAAAAPAEKVPSTTSKAATEKVEQKDNDADEVKVPTPGDMPSPKAENVKTGAVSPISSEKAPGKTEAVAAPAVAAAAAAAEKGEKESSVEPAQRKVQVDENYDEE
ncbi:hypothetical protein BCR37DRAFT_393569 [Protomyces lactucae-debilis]|uniref:Uncharacterized protein n=1 Tax=Protomyces lactucae-debilis TaxID=2754530 RepID=A0A1Y2FDJ6_PROLT|nr:uncharacterized protein BCR37DRAFT_393569 [Protomyces lactucae-debilis]ORY80925.1 hypothetical protein BCR37DRAFT_393569 [Protomyces lactucae-debilis]